MIHDKLSHTDYVIGTPERRKKSRVCYINMLKPYCVKEPSSYHNPQTDKQLSTVSSALIVTGYSELAEDDGLKLHSMSSQSLRC